MKLLSVVLFLTMLWSVDNSADGEKKLLSHLESNLPKFTMPPDLKDNKVHLQVKLIQLLDADTKTGTLEVKLLMWSFYEVQSAKWDPAEFDNLTSITVPKDSFWNPNFEALQTVRSRYEGLKTQTILNTGYVQASNSIQTLRVACDFDVTHFPFDEQTCSMTFAPSALIGRKFDIGNGGLLESSEIVKSIENDEWEIQRPMEESIVTLATFDAPDGSFDALNIRVTFKRRALFYTTVVLLPAVTLHFLSTLIFFLPVESGEKVGFALTLFLAQAVMFATLIDLLPSSSMTLPILVAYVSFVTLYLAAVCVMAVFLVSFHVKHRMSPRYQMIIRSRKLRCLGLKPYRCHDDMVSEPASASEPSIATKPGNKLLESESISLRDTHLAENIEESKLDESFQKSQKLYPQLQNEKAADVRSSIHEGASNQLCPTVNNGEENQQMWKLFVDVLDRVFLLIHIVVTVFSSIMFLIRF